MENLHFIAKRELDVSVLFCTDYNVFAQRTVEGNLRKFLSHMTGDTRPLNGPKNLGNALFEDLSSCFYLTATSLARGFVTSRPQPWRHGALHAWVLESYLLPAWNSVWLSDLSLHLLCQQPPRTYKLRFPPSSLVPTEAIVQLVGNQLWLAANQIFPAPLLLGRLGNSCWPVSRSECVDSRLEHLIACVWLSRIPQWSSHRTRSGFGAAIRLRSLTACNEQNVPAIWHVAGGRNKPI